MKFRLTLITMLLATGLSGQTELQIIGRNVGTKVLEDGHEIRVFGFTQSLLDNPNVPGPTLEFEEGDSIILDFWNVSQGAPHTIHLHGLDVDQANDGVPHLSFEVHHMDHGYYRFRAPHPGTYLYHCHVVSSIHVQAGMYGMIIVRPKGSTNETWSEGIPFYEESSLLFSEIDTIWHHDSVLLHEYDTSQMHQHVALPKYRPQHFLVNGWSGQSLVEKESLYMKMGGNYYLRLANMGYCYNEVVFPNGFAPRWVSSDGRPLPIEVHSDTSVLFPGERHGIILNAAAELSDSIRVSYKSLNTDETLGVATIPIVVQDAYGQASIESDGRISIYPNPASSEVHIEFTGHRMDETLIIIDSKGNRQLKIQAKGPASIDVQKWVPGWYGVLKNGAQPRLLGSFIVVH